MAKCNHKTKCQNCFASGRSALNENEFWCESSCFSLALYSYYQVRLHFLLKFSAISHVVLESSKQYNML